MNKKEKFKSILYDYHVWLDYAIKQKKVADILMDNIHKNKNDIFIIWSSVHFHFAMGIENGLKGLIIKNNPDQINLLETEDNIIIKNIGGKGGKIHNLSSLARLAGIFNRQLNIYEAEVDYLYLENVLNHLSDCIKWISRYPIQNNLLNVYKYDSKKIPHPIIYGFHILDIIEPIFNLFEKELDS